LYASSRGRRSMPFLARQALGNGPPGVAQHGARLHELPARAGAQIGGITLHRTGIAAPPRGAFETTLWTIADPRRNRRRLPSRQQHSIALVEFHGSDPALWAQRRVAVGGTVRRPAIVHSITHLRGGLCRRIPLRTLAVQWKVREDAGDEPHIGFGTSLAVVARHASTRGSPHDCEAAIQFLGCDDWRDGAVAAKLTGTGERGRNDDERTTGQAKHATMKANAIPAKNREFRSLVPGSAYKSAARTTIWVSRNTQNAASG
jgi:hypothetical protein